MDVLKEVGEQILHLLWAFVPLTVLWAIAPSGATWRSVPAFAVAGLLWALPREIVDQWPIERVWDTILDLSFFLIGGALAGVLAWRVKRHE